MTTSVSSPARALGAAAVLLAVSATVPAVARAQLPGVPGVNPFGFGVEAGPAFPVGNFGSLAKAGFTADALVDVRVPVLPVGLRFEGGYASFGGRAGYGTTSMGSGTANVVLRLSPVALSLVRPYLIGGVGVYAQNQGLGTSAGVNVGGGLSLPLAVVTAFGDVRYTRVFNAGVRTTFVPVRVGVRF